MKIRLFGDAVLRRRAWEIATELGWAETYTAEYIALTQLQADAFVTLDAKLARPRRARVRSRRPARGGSRRARPAAGRAGCSRGNSAGCAARPRCARQ